MTFELIPARRIMHLRRSTKALHQILRLDPSKPLGTIVCTENEFEAYRGKALDGHWKKLAVSYSEACNSQLRQPLVQKSAIPSEVFVALNVQLRAQPITSGIGKCLGNGKYEFWAMRNTQTQVTYAAQWSLLKEINHFLLCQRQLNADLCVSRSFEINIDGSRRLHRCGRRKSNLHSTAAVKLCNGLVWKSEMPKSLAQLSGTQSFSARLVQMPDHPPVIWLAQFVCIAILSKFFKKWSNELNRMVSMGTWIYTSRTNS